MLARLMLVRHAEKPVDGVAGVDALGRPDPASLTPRGWQRAGALVALFTSPPPPLAEPDAIFAAADAPGDSRRPQQTAEPLARRLAQRRGVPFVTRHRKDELDALAADVNARDGTVLLVWEHKLAGAAVEAVTGGAVVPPPWPADRYDRVWVLDRTPGGWRFTDVPQRLLAGDAP